jgi:hypothetical protein
MRIASLCRAAFRPAALVSPRPILSMQPANEFLQILRQICGYWAMNPSIIPYNKHQNIVIFFLGYRKATGVVASSDRNPTASAKTIRAKPPGKSPENSVMPGFTNRAPPPVGDRGHAEPAGGPPLRRFDWVKARTYIGRRQSRRHHRDSGRTVHRHGRNPAGRFSRSAPRCRCRPDRTCRLG